MEEKPMEGNENGNKNLTETITPNEDYYALKRALMILTANEKSTKLKENDLFLEDRETQQKITPRENLIAMQMKAILVKAVELNKEWISELHLKKQSTSNHIVKNFKDPMLKSTDSFDEILKERCHVSNSESDEQIKTENVNLIENKVGIEKQKLAEPAVQRQKDYDIEQEQLDFADENNKITASEGLSSSTQQINLNNNLNMKGTFVTETSENKLLQLDLNKSESCREEDSHKMQKAAAAKASLRSMVLHQLKHYYELYLKSLGDTNTPQHDCKGLTMCDTITNDNLYKFQSVQEHLKYEQENNAEDSLSYNMFSNLSEHQVWKALQAVLEEVIPHHLLTSQIAEIQQLQSINKDFAGNSSKIDNDNKTKEVTKQNQITLLPRINCDDNEQLIESQKKFESSNESNQNCTEFLDNTETEHMAAETASVLDLKANLNNTVCIRGKSFDINSTENCIESSPNELAETILEAPEEFRVVPGEQSTNDYLLELSDQNDNIIKPNTTEAVDTTCRAQSPSPNILACTPTSTGASSSSEASVLAFSGEVHSMSLLSTLHGLKVAMAECTGSIDGVGVGVGVETHLRAPGCSRETDADRERTPVTEQKTDSCFCSAKDSSCDKCSGSGVEENRSSPLRWAFKNGRLVFVEEEKEGKEDESEGEEEQDGEIIHSKELNKRITGSC